MRATAGTTQKPTTVAASLAKKWRRGGVLRSVIRYPLLGSPAPVCQQSPIIAYEGGGGGGQPQVSKPHVLPQDVGLQLAPPQVPMQESGHVLWQVGVQLSPHEPPQLSVQVGTQEGGHEPVQQSLPLSSCAMRGPLCDRRTSISNSSSAAAVRRRKDAEAGDAPIPAIPARPRITAPIRVTTSRRAPSAGGEAAALSPPRPRLRKTAATPATPTKPRKTLRP
ncbi:MAG: hypothetical protein KGQ94_00425 [Alphaproteobacteria bacterium]|nr:hypothetical protein [Alphaproteobacteria bacterium]